MGVLKGFGAKNNVRICRRFDAKENVKDDVFHEKMGEGKI